MAEQLHTIAGIERNGIINAEALCDAWKFTITNGDYLDPTHEYMLKRLRNMISGAMTFTNIGYSSEEYLELWFLRELIDTGML